jgi:hypothetical protein
MRNSRKVHKFLLAASQEFEPEITENIQILPREKKP